MTLAAAPPRPTAAPTRRDAAVDVARAWCLTVVVATHALMVGVSVTSGTPVLENALEQWSGFAAATWFVQVMPLFFLLGGFSGIQQWERARGRGVRSGEHLAGRLRRLLVPALAAVLAAVLVLAGLRVAGVQEDLAAAAGFRLSQPLWFLAVYVLCTAALPPLVAAHRRRPLVTIGALAAGVVAVDAVRSATGMDAVGLVNLAFVWLLVQQLGFVLASPGAAAWPRRRTGLLAVAAFGALALLCLTGVYSADLYANLNPPTGALVLLGVGQLALFSLVRPWLVRLASVSPVGRYVSALNRRAMTIYSWHMLVLVLSAGALLLVGGESLPAPLGEQWWLTRPLWLAGVAVAVILVAHVAGRWEAGPSDGWRIAGRRRALAAAVAGAAGVVLILVEGSTLAGWVGGAALVFGGLMLLRERTRPTPP